MHFSYINCLIFFRNSGWSVLSNLCEETNFLKYSSSISSTLIFPCNKTINLWNVQFNEKPVTMSRSFLTPFLLGCCKCIAHGFGIVLLGSVGNTDFCILDSVVLPYCKGTKNLTKICRINIECACRWPKIWINFWYYTVTTDFLVIV